MLVDVVGSAGVVDRPCCQAGGVNGPPARSPALSGAAPAVWLQLARGGTLAVAVEGPEGGGAEEGIPAFGVEAPDFFVHAFVAGGQGGQVRDEDCL
eukprot:3808676-Pleurochrysis_carterae.AAC.1